MKKLIGIAVVVAVVLTAVLATGAFAAGPGTVTVTAGGNGGGSINVTTYEADGTSGDTLAVTSDGAYCVNQVDSFVNTTGNAYTSNNGEISRTVGIGNDVDSQSAADGSIATTTGMESTQPYYLYDATTTTNTTTTGGGAYLQEGLAFSDESGSGVSGVASYYYYPWEIVDNTMTLNANGNYSLDVNDTGASIAPSLGSMPSGSLPACSLDVNSTASSGNSTLEFTPTADSPQSGSACAGGLSNTTDHGQNTTLTTNFILGWTGTPAVSANVSTVAGGNMSIVENFVNNTVTGSGYIQ